MTLLPTSLREPMSAHVFDHAWEAERARLTGLSWD
jgi:hypothetical protein